MTSLPEWDARFRSDEYLFGTDPSVFVTEHAHWLSGHRDVLCIADGEGRNGAWLAARGYRVTAFDGSVEAHRKALKLDQAMGVSVTRTVDTLDGWEWGAARWDAIVGVFIQFAPPAMRARMFDAIRGALRPGGVLLVHGYTPKQLVYRTGGPDDVTHLYTPALLEDAFGDWDIRVMRDYEREITEGRGHAGMSALLDMVAIKPAVDVQS